MYLLVIAITAILVSWFIVNYIKWKQTVVNPIEKIGGPKAYPIVGTLHHFMGAKRHEIFKIVTEMKTKYKPFFRTWNGSNPDIHVIKPEHLEKIMTSSVNIKKGHGYKFLKTWLGDGLLLSDGAKWHQRRKMITPTFHFKMLDNFMNVFEEKSKLLIDHLEEKSDGEGFDVYPYITHCALDIICETAMGVSINAMSNRNSDYIRAIYDNSELVIRRAFSLLKQTKLYPLFSEGKQFQKNLETMHKFADKVIADRRRILKDNPAMNQNEDADDITMSKKKRLSLLDLLLDASDKISDEGIREEVDTFMFGGHDTTTAAICWNLFLLANHPDIQKRVYQEVKGVLNDKKAPSSILELNDMKYLEYCIKEALRLYPSVPMVARTLTEDIVIDGYNIPKGTDCTLHIYDAHRNPEVFPEPDKFDPERFLPENCTKRHPYAYVPFSAGPRNCIGQKFAMYQAKTQLSSIVRSYEILPVDTVETVRLVAEIVLKPMDGMSIALKKRTD